MLHLERPTRVAPCVPPEAPLLQFSTISLDEVAKLKTQACKPTTWMLDYLPTEVLKELLPTVDLLCSTCQLVPVNFT